MTLKDNTKDALIFAAALGIPILAASQNSWGFLVDIMVVAPFAWLGLRRSILQSMFGVVIAALGIYLVTGSADLAISKGLLVMGVSSVFALGLAKGWRPGEIIFWASLPAIGYGVYSLMQIAQGPVLLRDPIAVVEGALTSNLGTFLEEYRKAGGFEMAKAQGLSETQVKEVMEQGFKLIARLFPSILFISGIFNVALSFLATRFLLKRGMGRKISIGPFRNWSIPWYAIWGAIIGIASYLAGSNWGIPGLITAGLNIIVVYFIVCVLLGVSVATYFFASPKFPLLFKIMFIFIMFFNLPVTSIVLALFGLFDMVMNFRKLPSNFETGGKI